MRRLLLGLAVLSLGLVAVPRVVHADVNDFTVTNFTADYYLTKNDPQGALDIKEQLEVNFTDSNHGILRALPERYNGQILHLHIDSVEMDNNSEEYTTSTSNGNLVLKIGNPNSTVTGAHNYKIDYHVVNAIRFTSTSDVLDWNTNGTEWSQLFLSETARLHLTQDESGAAEHGFSCFTGAQGNGQQDCTVDATNNLATFTTTRTLNAGETMTFQANFKQGTFTKPGFKDWLSDYGKPIALMTVPPLLALLIAGSYWRKNGKDLKGHGTIVPEYGPPDGLRAAEVDTVVNYKPGKNAISATIIDLAIRKYLKIQESESDGLLGIGKHKEYTFIRLPMPIGEALNDYENRVLTGLFPSGDTTVMSELKTTFYVTAKAVQKQLTADLTAKGYFSLDPAKAGNSGHAIGIVLVFGAFVFISISIWFAIGAALAGAITLIFASLMTRRTQKGVDAKDAIEGLKLYMNTAEKDRLAMLQSANAPYAAPSAEPIKTIDLFEKLLPFAMVLGVEKTWGQQFASIYTSPPDWYGGNWSTFNAIYLTESLNNSMSAMNTSFAAPSSGGSGMGGGFAGGGGGGGGGGGW